MPRCVLGNCRRCGRSWSDPQVFEPGLAQGGGVGVGDGTRAVIAHHRHAEAAFGKPGDGAVQERDRADCGQIVEYLGRGEASPIVDHHVQLDVDELAWVPALGAVRRLQAAPGETAYQARFALATAIPSRAGRSTPRRSRRPSSAPAATLRSPAPAAAANATDSGEAAKSDQLTRDHLPATGAATSRPFERYSPQPRPRAATSIPPQAPAGTATDGCSDRSDG